MYVMYGAYVLAFWLVLAASFAIQLPWLRNPSSGAIAYLLIGPAVVIGCSAELLIFVSKRDKVALSIAFAEKRLSWHRAVAVGVCCALLAAALVAIVWVVTSALWNSWTAVGFVFVVSALVLLLVPAFGLAFLITKAKTPKDAPSPTALNDRDGHFI
jgi:hypothetical protein